MLIQGQGPSGARLTVWSHVIGVKPIQLESEPVEDFKGCLLN
jgi:hypothetical protein